MNKAGTRWAMNGIREVVFAVGSDTQMIGPNTQTCLAKMIDDFAVRDWADERSIGKAMSCDLSAVEVEAAVIRAELTACPKPAVLSFLDVFHKALNRRFRVAPWNFQWLTSEAPLSMHPAKQRAAQGT